MAHELDVWRFAERVGTLALIGCFFADPPDEAWSPECRASFHTASGARLSSAPHRDRSQVDLDLGF